MPARFAGRCAECGERFEAGALIVWFPTTREATHAGWACQDPVNRRALAKEAAR
jgi:hypothetical protein